ncbi:hypothetical protein DFA_00100 [Cavenderia fasciculata]|uniref:Transmembrane protein n=1 Tax=Cavenderia fasciculata TaxID=261658 RepID=F4PXL2_CACFS|nr:uncharacterized protein DFA_00100 [Cavenderia fasciculata]EGG19522.1 hypothetical protein DFA_00100 [Cavenderia fasciculata]|eukprot:XP_004357816.1 hypothetical protein DFA_00100 [Cavenderia fasciculata]
MSILFLSDQDISGITLGVVGLVVWYLIHKSHGRFAHGLLVSLLASSAGFIVASSINGYATANEKLIDFCVAALILTLSVLGNTEGSRKSLLLGLLVETAWSLLHHVWFSHVFAPRTAIPYYFPLFVTVFNIGIIIYYYDIKIDHHKKR